MDANWAQVIIAIIVAAGGILTATISKRKPEDGGMNDDGEETLLREQIARLENELAECEAQKIRDRSTYFEILATLQARMTKPKKRPSR
jgi:hypothetical protein